MKREIFEIKETPFVQLIVAIVSIIWIGFAIYNFDLNKVFFGVSILTAVFIVLFLNRMYIKLEDDFLSIHFIRIIPFLSVEVKYPLAEIEKIELDGIPINENFRLNRDISMIFPNAQVVRHESLNIKRKNTKWKKYQLLSSNEKYEKLINRIRDRQATS